MLIDDIHGQPVDDGDTRPTIQEAARAQHEIAQRVHLELSRVTKQHRQWLCAHLVGHLQDLVARRIVEHHQARCLVDVSGEPCTCIPDGAVENRGALLEAEIDTFDAKLPVHSARLANYCPLGLVVMKTKSAVTGLPSVPALSAFSRSLSAAR